MSALKELPLGVYEKAISNHLPWEEKFLVAKRAGFDYVEISIDGTPERLKRLYDKKDIHEIRDVMEHTGMPVYTMALTANRYYPLGSEDPKIREEGIELVRRAIDFAEELDIQVIHLAAYDELGDKANDRTKYLFRESVAQCANMAEGHAPYLALETMDTPFMGSCTNIVRLCREIGSEKLRCYADIGNMTALGLDPAQELPVGGQWIAGIHLKDARPGVCRDIPFGEGTVDFEKSLQVLQEMDYNGYMTAEMWSYDDESFHDYLKTASQFLRDKLSK